MRFNTCRFSIFQSGSKITSKIVAYAGFPKGQEGKAQSCINRDNLSVPQKTNSYPSLTRIGYTFRISIT